MLAGVAPQVVLKATHRKALEVCRLEDLVAHAVDPPSGNEVQYGVFIHVCWIWVCVFQINEGPIPSRLVWNGF